MKIPKVLHRAGRRFNKVLRRDPVESVALLTAGNLTLSGLTLLFSAQSDVLPSPTLFGAAYLFMVALALHGVFERRSASLAAFGFFGFFLRVWMATAYFRSDWRDPSWCSFALGAVAFGWIAARSACRYAWICARRSAAQSYLPYPAFPRGIVLDARC